MPRARPLRRSRGWQAAVFGISTDRMAQTGPGAAVALSTLRSLSELTVIAAAATTDTTIQIPANAIVQRVEVTVMVAIPTAATFDYGVAGATARYGSAISVTPFATWAGANDGNRLYASGTAIRFTPNLTPGANSGRVQTTIWYWAPG